MEKTDFTVTLSVKKSPSSVFKTLLNVQRWWSGLYGEEFTGSSENIGDVFTFKAGDGAHYTEQKLVELIPDKRLVWLVTASDLTFLDKPDEWEGTKLIFDVSERDGHTEVKFTHEGLTGKSECYDNCAPAWSQYMHTNLLPMINE